MWIFSHTQHSAYKDRDIEPLWSERADNARYKCILQTGLDPKLFTRRFQGSQPLCSAYSPPKMKLLVALAAFAVAFIGQVTAEECKTVCEEIYAPVCGSDGKTYDNRCIVDAEKCTTKNEALGVIDQGVCLGPPGCNQPCPEPYAPVCGSDGVTYGNQCTLRMARCDRPASTLRVTYAGPCKPSDIPGDNATHPTCT